MCLCAIKKLLTRSLWCLVAISPLPVPTASRPVRWSSSIGFRISEIGVTGSHVEIFFIVYFCTFFVCKLLHWHILFFCWGSYATVVGVTGADGFILCSWLIDWLIYWLIQWALHDIWSCYFCVFVIQEITRSSSWRDVRRMLPAFLLLASCTLSVNRCWRSFHRCAICLLLHTELETVNYCTKKALRLLVYYSFVYYIL